MVPPQVLPKPPKVRSKPPRSHKAQNCPKPHQMWSKPVQICLSSPSAFSAWRPARPDSRRRSRSEPFRNGRNGRQVRTPTKMCARRRADLRDAAQAPRAAQRGRIGTSRATAWCGRRWTAWPERCPASTRSGPLSDSGPELRLFGWLRLGCKLSREHRHTTFRGGPRELEVSTWLGQARPHCMWFGPNLSGLNQAREALAGGVDRIRVVSNPVWGWCSTHLGPL